MTHNRKSLKFLISLILCLAAVLAVLCTWSPLLLTIYNNIKLKTIPVDNGFEVPIRVVGVNYPTISFIWLGVSFVIFITILFSQKRKASSCLFWINGISVAIILSHLIMWIFLTSPLPAKVQANTQPDWLIKKTESMAKHDQIQVENEKQAASYERPPVNQSLINTVTDVYKDKGVFTVASDETNLPFSSAIQAQYKFTTKAFMADDFLISGAKSSDPTCGFITDIKTNPKTMQDTLITYDFSGQGAITFNNISDNKLYFKNANGDVGQLDIASNKYTGVLPTKPSRRNTTIRN